MKTHAAFAILSVAGILAGTAPAQKTEIGRKSESSKDRGENKFKIITIDGRDYELRPLPRRVRFSSETKKSFRPRSDTKTRVRFGPRSAGTKTRFGPRSDTKSVSILEIAKQPVTILEIAKQPVTVIEIASPKVKPITVFEIAKPKMKVKRVTVFEIAEPKEARPSVSVVKSRSSTHRLNGRLENLTRDVRELRELLERLESRVSSRRRARRK